MNYKSCTLKFLLIGLTYFSINISSMESQVDPASKKASYYHDKILGSLVGGALADALGKPIEFCGSLNEHLSKKYEKEQSNQHYFFIIKENYENGITGIQNLKKSDYRKNKDQEVVVPYSDDTAMALPLFEALLKTKEEKRNLDATMSDLSYRYIIDMLEPYGWAASEREPGKACKTGVTRLREKVKNGKTEDKKWWKVGELHSGGCGSLMRVHPCGLVFANEPEIAEKFAIAQSSLTHCDPIAYAACAAQTRGIIAALHGETVEKIIDIMIKTARKYSEKTANRMKIAHQTALKLKGNFTTIEEAIEGSQSFYNKYQGWAAHDAIAGVIYAFTLCPDDLKSAIAIAINQPGDSDSVGSMVGALVGARTGFGDQLTEEDLQIQLKENAQLIKLEGIDRIKNNAKKLTKVFFQEKSSEISDIE